MPKANLRPVFGGAPVQDFECSVCQAKFSGKCNVVDPKTVAVLKASIFKQWDAHLYSGAPTAVGFPTKEKGEGRGDRPEREGSHERLASEEARPNPRPPIPSTPRPPKPLGVRCSSRAAGVVDTLAATPFPIVGEGGTDRIDQSL